MKQYIYTIKVLMTLTICVSASYLLKAQNLDKNVTIHAENITISQLLKELGEKTNVKFSYNPKLIKANKRISVNGHNESARTVLEKVFDHQYQFKMRGRYVIITPMKSSSDKSAKPNEIQLSGAIIDEETGDGLANASVFTSSGQSTITDETGAFSLTIGEDESSILEARKQGYAPTSFDSERISNHQIEVAMIAHKSLSILVDVEDIKPLSTIEVPKHEYINTIFPINQEFKINQANINDTLRKPATVSLYPGFSTYGNLSGSIIFRFALNFVGYNRGIDGLELAALSNINKENVRGVQLAGLSNYVGGKVKGIQMAGIFNSVNGSVDGVQIAGITNVTQSPMNALQIAGISNHITTYGKGIQVSGIANTAANFSGVQLGGLTNIVDTISGSQISGLSNHALSFNGVQVAGLLNTSSGDAGTQISGLVNIGKKIKGSQIGVINIADSISGVPIGLFSFVKKNGYQSISAYADEIFPLNIGFTTGIRKFHTGVSVGGQKEVFKKEASLFNLAFNVGSSFKLSKNIHFDLELSSQLISRRPLTTVLSNKYRTYLGLDITLFRSLSLMGGVTINGYNLDKSLLKDPLFSNIRPHYFYTYDSPDNGSSWRCWVGYKWGLRWTI